MTLREPLWLLALLALPLSVGVQQLLARRGDRYALRFPGVPTLAAVALPTNRRRRYVAPVLLLAALAGMLLAMARPERTVAVATQRTIVVLIVDTSGSMNAEDVEPNRMDAAKRAAQTYIDQLPGRLELGAVAYSDRPHTRQEPTADHDEIRSLVDSLNAEGATATGDAIQTALTLVEQRRRTLGARVPAAIVLLSDGKTTAGRDPLLVAQEARRQRIPISTVALGTPDGVIFDPAGTPVPVPPDPETLRRIAQITGGQAFDIDDPERLDSVYEQLGSRVGTRQEKREMTSSVAMLVAILLAGALGAAVRWNPRLP